MQIFAGDHRIAENVDAAQPIELRLLHKILYGSETTLNWIRRKVQKFEGFDFGLHSPQFEVRLSLIENAELENVRKTCELLEIPIGNDVSTRQLAIAIMMQIFRLADPSPAEATNKGYFAPVSQSLLNQSMEYGFTEKSRNSNPFRREPSIADSKTSSKTVQVTVMRAKLNAEKQLAELEEKQAREKRMRAEKVLNAEMELQIAEAALAEELAQGTRDAPRDVQWFQNLQEVDPVDRVQQWISNLQTIESSKTECADPVIVTKRQCKDEPSGGHTSHDEERTQKTCSINSEMVQLTKSMQRMLVRSTGGEYLPNFDGNVREWQLFINQYRLSTAAGEYSEMENVVRLNKCLTGKAREAVQQWHQRMLKRL